MNKETRLQVLKEAQNLRNHIENVTVITEDVKDDAVKSYLTLIWTDVQSLVEYLVG